MTFSIQNLFVALVASCLMCGFAYWLERNRSNKEAASEDYLEFIAKRHPRSRRIILFLFHIAIFQVLVQLMSWEQDQPDALVYVFPLALSVGLGMLLSLPPEDKPGRWKDAQDGPREEWRKRKRLYDAVGRYENGWFFGQAMFLAAAEMTAAFIVAAFTVVLIPGDVTTVLWFMSPLAVGITWGIFQLLEPKTNWLESAKGKRPEFDIPQSAPTVETEQRNAKIPTAEEVAQQEQQEVHQEREAEFERRRKENMRRSKLT